VKSLLIRSSATLSPWARRSAEYAVHKIVWLSSVRRSQSEHGVALSGGAVLALPITREVSAAAAAIIAGPLLVSICSP
jgi:hypothetical protein